MVPARSREGAEAVALVVFGCASLVFSTVLVVSGTVRDSGTKALTGAGVDKVWLDLE